MKKAVEKETKTAKCPDCGGNYIKQTGYCPSCKKKVKEMRDVDRYDDYTVEWYEERGQFSITVYDQDFDEIIWSAEDEDAVELVEDGFIKFFGDTAGLIKHLTSMRILKENTAEESTMETIKVTKEVQINESTILEPGDKVQVIKENYNYYYKEISTNAPVDEYGVTMKIGSSKHIPLNRESLQALNDFFEREMA